MEDSKKTCDISKADVPDSSGSKDLSKSLPEEAFNNFLQGKRSMLVQDYSFAVQSLAQACEMYVNHFGELAIECAEVYLLYGKALFRLSQQQAGVLGGALNEGSNEEETSESDSNENENETDKNSDGEGGEEENEAENEGEENEAENEEENEPEKEEKEPSESTDSPQAVIDEGSSDVKAENSEAKGEASEAAKSAEPSNKDESKTDTADDQAPISEGSKVEGSMEENTEVEEDDLELAWNTLETAKSIFKRKDTVEAQLKVAEILQLLAEISMESDNNAQAISDLNECLEIQKKHLKPDDRILAETYYQKGLALMLDKIYPAALENFNATKKILELRVENLKNTKVDDADGTFASADLQIEISDLEAILLDIKEKIDDTEELITNKKKEQEELTEEPMMFSSPIKETVEKGSPAKPVSNITHLLKRKKPDEGTSADSAKRIKVTTVPTTVVNGETNVTETEAKKAEG